MARTQTLQLQYLYTLNFHLMKVLSLILFNERLYKASNIGLFLKKLEKLEKNHKTAREGNRTPDFCVKGRSPNH